MSSILVVWMAFGLFTCGVVIRHGVDTKMKNEHIVFLALVAIVLWPVVWGLSDTLIKIDASHMNGSKQHSENDTTPVDDYPRPDSDGAL